MDDIFLSYITRLYRYFTENYPNSRVYFSQYLKQPSCCIEDKNFKYEFHISENSMQNNEVWLYSDKTNKKDYSGCGYGEKLTNIIEQAESFMKKTGFKVPERQMTLFDFMEA